MIIIHGMKKKYVPRIQTEILARGLAAHPVVVLHGARQTGKSTLAQSEEIGKGRKYFSLDDMNVLELARRDPEALLLGAKRITLDEVQREPALLLAVKRLVDAGREPGRFFLTGSANLLLMKRISETLAGRAVYVRLPPFTWAECLGRGFGGRVDAIFKAKSAGEGLEALDMGPSSGPRPAALREAVFCGGYPVPALHLPSSERAGWFDGYVQTYLERDLRDFSATDNLLDFRRLMRIAAMQTGRALNRASLARDAGVSPATAQRYLAILQASFQAHFVPAFAVNRSKRLIKAPKLFLGDTGLAAFLAGFTEPDELFRSREWGMWLENWVFIQLSAYAALRTPAPAISHFRTAAGQEVDFVLEGARNLLPIEVKATRRPNEDDTRGLALFLDEYPRAKLGLLLCFVEEPQLLSRRILALPVHKVFVEDS